MGYRKHLYLYHYMILFFFVHLLSIGPESVSPHGVQSLCTGYTLAIYWLNPIICTLTIYLKSCSFFFFSKSHDVTGSLLISFLWQRCLWKFQVWTEHSCLRPIKIRLNSARHYIWHIVYNDQQNPRENKLNREKRTQWKKHAVIDINSYYTWTWGWGFRTMHIWETKVKEQFRQRKKKMPARECNLHW